MEAVYLDTHVVVWLFQGDLTRFSERALQLMERHDLLVSAMVMMELAYLYEIGRVTYRPIEILSELEKTIDLSVCREQFVQVVYRGLDLTWTRDPFDRLIVANAAYSVATLITKDQNILDHYERAVW